MPHTPFWPTAVLRQAWGKLLLLVLLPPTPGRGLLPSASNSVSPSGVYTSFCLRYAALLLGSMFPDVLLSLTPSLQQHETTMHFAPSTCCPVTHSRQHTAVTTTRSYSDCKAALCCRYSQQAASAKRPSLLLPKWAMKWAHLSAAISMSSACTPHCMISSTISWFLLAVAYSPAQ